MIGALAVILDEAQRFFRIDGSIDEVIEKKFAGGVVRAAIGRKYAAFVQDFQGAEVDFLISAHRVDERLFVSGETRRIENDQIVFRFCVLEEIEDVVLEHFNFDVVDFRVVASGGAGNR